MTLFPVRLTLFLLLVTLHVTPHIRHWLIPIVSEVTVELPFTVVFEPPSRSELRAMLYLRGTWVISAVIALAIGTAFCVTGMGRREAVASESPLAVQLTSQPSGARVWVDERDAGLTPMSFNVAPGAHNLAFKAQDMVDARYSVQAAQPGAALHAVLWRRQPLATRLRSTLPGAQLVDARLMASGDVALALSVPSSRQLQSWRLEPETGAVEPVLVDAYGSRVVVSDDGALAAVFGSEPGPAPQSPMWSAPAATVVWLYERGGTTAIRAWRPPLATAEQVVDAAWSPRADRMFVVTTQSIASGVSMSRVWFVDTTSLEAVQTSSFPSEVVPGTASWSPDGLHVAFVAHATGLDAMCVVDLAGDFRYVADLDPRVEQAPGYPVGAWTPDSARLVFVAPKQRPPGANGAWFQPPDPSRVLYVADLAEASPTALTDTTIDLATWREGGEIYGLGRVGSGGALDMRLMNGTPSGEHLLELPLKPAGAYAVDWDVAHAQVVVASAGGGGGPEFWLIRLGWSSRS